MGALLEACLDEGAFGLTSGLVFIPAAGPSRPSWCSGPGGGPAGRPLRHPHPGRAGDERRSHLELLETAERAGVRANVSHMQSKWPVYGNGALKVSCWRRAVAGVDVTCDYEIYAMNSATLGSFFQIYHLSARAADRDAGVSRRAGLAEADDARDRAPAPPGAIRSGRGVLPPGLGPGDRLGLPARPGHGRPVGRPVAAERGVEPRTPCST